MNLFVIRRCIWKCGIVSRSFLARCEGATAVEYGLIAAAIAVTISAGVFMFGSNLSDLFSSSSDMVSSRP